MRPSQSDKPRALRMRRGERVLHLLGVEAQTLADHLDELPTVIAEIDALEDEVSRRRAKVAVREALADFRTLHWRLQRAIARLSEMCDVQETIAPSARATPMTGEPGRPGSRVGGVHESARAMLRSSAS